MYGPSSDLALFFLLENNHSVCSLQFDNLNAAHETTKLEIEASHSEKVELLKKTYETSLSGKGASPASGDRQWKRVVFTITKLTHDSPLHRTPYGIHLADLLVSLCIVHCQWMPFSLKDANYSWLFVPGL